MADRLKIIAALGMLAAAAPSAPQAAAQPLADPTRPYATPAAESEGQGGGLVLQSVMISPLQRLAIISGRLVKLGDQVGGATVVSIAETEVALKEGTQVQTLRLYPGVDKRQAGKSASAKVVR